MNIEQTLIKTLGFGAQEFIERAVKGGWKYDDYCDGRGCKDRHIFLSSAAWKAVGKVEGWGNKPGPYALTLNVEVRWLTMKPDGEGMPEKIERDMRETRIKYRIEQAALDAEDEGWSFHMHRFIDALAEEESSKA